MRKNLKNQPEIIKGGKIYKLISNIAIIGIFVAIGILVLSIGGMLALSANMFGLSFSVAVVCLALITTLPWVKRLEGGHLKKTSIVFIAFIGVCALLWIIAIWLVVALINKGEQSSPESILGTMNYIKISIMISIQLLVSSFMGGMIAKYQKEYIPFQVITSLSYLFVDFYLTYLLFCLKISPTDPNPISVADAISFLGGRWMITLLVLAIVYTIVSNTILKSIETRKMRDAADTLSGHKVGDIFHNNAKHNLTSEQKLEKIKELFDKNLITEEEYNIKRSEILKDM